MAQAPFSEEMLATMFTCVNGTPTPDGQEEYRMVTFNVELRRHPNLKLGVTCVHVSSTRVCGLLIKSVDEPSTIATWNSQSTDPEIIRPGDFIVKVNGVDGNESGVSALAEALRIKDEVMHISVWGARACRAEPRQPTSMSKTVEERIRQLEQRSRVCCRSEWESVWLKDLPHNSRIAAAATSGTCTVCMDSIDSDAMVRGLTCGHYFHLDCLANWFMADRSLDICCPMCRLSLVESPAHWVSL